MDQEKTISVIRFAVRDTGKGFQLIKSPPFSNPSPGGFLDHPETWRDRSGTFNFKTIGQDDGGQIGVESKEGEGSTFGFTLRLQNKR